MELVLPWPPTLNHYRIPIKHPKRHYCYLITSPEGKQYKANLKSIIKNPPNIKQDINVSIVFHPKTKAKFDIDNFFKALLDGLTEAGVWEDDSQIRSLHGTKGEVIKGGKVVITIELVDKELR